MVSNAWGLPQLVSWGVIQPGSFSPDLGSSVNYYLPCLLYMQRKAVGWLLLRRGGSSLHESALFDLAIPPCAWFDNHLLVNILHR
jgi:hypothetical protein